MDGHIDLRSDRLTKNKQLTAGNLATKALHDSCYIAPEKNFRVIQDDDPAKNRAWKEALQRHEQKIQQQKNFNEKIVQRHFEVIKSDESVIQVEKDNAKGKQRQFYEDIQNQMNSNVRALTLHSCAANSLLS